MTRATVGLICCCAAGLIGIAATAAICFAALLEVL